LKLVSHWKSKKGELAGKAAGCRCKCFYAESQATFLRSLL
jgi:hypothetical protein